MQLQKALENVDIMILAIKAMGGYKERKKFRLSDREIDQLCATSEPAIRMTAVYLVVAEQMLREPPPSLHPRWEEFLRRREDAMEELKTK